MTSLQASEELRLVLDFKISGSRGFIGRHIFQRLQAAGFSVASDSDASKSLERAGVFVNCANVPGSPSASLALLSRKLDLARTSANCFVQIQSFVTLHGAGSINPALINCGMRPKRLDMYAVGKMAQERMIYSWVQRYRIPYVIFLYLPAVIGEGGGWSKAQAQAQKFGYALPRELDPMARANFIEVGDAADFLINRRSRIGTGLERAILNRQESAGTTWAEFLGENVRDTTVESPGARLKSQAMAFAYHAGILLPVERTMGLVRGDSPIERSHAIPQHELRFEGMTRYIVANQRYIPATSAQIQ